MILLYIDKIIAYQKEKRYLETGKLLEKIMVNDEEYKQLLLKNKEHYRNLDNPNYLKANSSDVNLQRKTQWVSKNMYYYKNRDWQLTYCYDNGYARINVRDRKRPVTKTIYKSHFHIKKFNPNRYIFKGRKTPFNNVLIFNHQNPTVALEILTYFYRTIAQTHKEWFQTNSY
jgi:hypothetical protein